MKILKDLAMELKLARTLINEKPKNISLEKIEEAIEKEGQKFFFLIKIIHTNNSLPL